MPQQPLVQKLIIVYLLQRRVCSLSSHIVLNQKIFKIMNNNKCNNRNYNNNYQIVLLHKELNQNNVRKFKQLAMFSHL